MPDLSWKTRKLLFSNEILLLLRKFKETDKEFSKVAKWQINQKKFQL